MKKLLLIMLLTLATSTVSHASPVTTEQRLNCYTSSVMKIWENYGEDKLSSQQIVYNLAESGAIKYDYDLESIVSVNKLKTPAELLGMHSEKKRIVLWQADKFFLSIPTATGAAPFLNKKIKAGLYADIRKIDSCKGVF